MLLKKIKVLGLSGNATAGKDLFCTIAIDILKKRGLIAKQFALANELKKDCEEFLKDKCNVNVWSTEGSVKSKFRPFLVWYGDFKRKETQGTYWTNKLKIQIDEKYNEFDVAIISDVRYDSYPEDELFWIKNTMNGKLVHITRLETTNENSDFPSYREIQPANDHEKENDPKMKRGADYQIVWKTQSYELLESKYLRSKVEDCLDVLL